MELILILFRQLIIMFLYMLIGYCLYCRKLLTKAGNKDLGKLLLYVILPCAIINSYLSVEFSPKQLTGLIWSFAAAILSLLTAILVSHLVFGNKNRIENFGAAFSNAGFMGIPIVQAIIGPEAVFYIATYVAMLNILQWTYGVVTMSGKKDAILPRKIITNPIVLSLVIGLCLYFFAIELPQVLQTTISSIAGMNAPIAMIVLGVYLAQTPFWELFTTKSVYLCTLFRLIVIPFLSIAILYIVPSAFLDVRLVVLVAAAAPVGSNVTIFAELNGLDSSRATKTVCLSTLCSIFTMPVVIGFAQMLWQMP